MANYIDYEYYSNEFGGDLIPEEEFEKKAIKASNEVRIRILNRDITGFETEVKNATCEVAEIIYNQDQLKENYQEMLNAVASGGSSGVITNEKVGDYSVTRSSLSMKELYSLCSKEELDSQIDDLINTALLFTGLLYRGISDIRDV